MKAIKFSKNIALIAVAAVGFAGFATAHADAPAAAPETRVVKFADLDINTPAGAKSLYVRIRSAAEAVCGDVGSKDLEKAVKARSCVDQAIVWTVRTVNHVELTRIATAHGYNVQAGIELASIR